MPSLHACSDFFFPIPICVYYLTLLILLHGESGPCQAYPALFGYHPGMETGLDRRLDWIETWTEAWIFFGDPVVSSLSVSGLHFEGYTRGLQLVHPVMRIPCHLFFLVRGSRIAWLPID